jgi:lipoate---protein ligase
VSTPAPGSGAETGGGWTYHRRAGTSEYLHDLDLLAIPGVTERSDAHDPSTPVSRSVWLLEPTSPSVVLGSAQRFASPAAAIQRAVGAGPGGNGRAGTEVVVRRSGGGAVALDPGTSLWVDVVLSRHDPLWVDDVAKSSYWLGQAWCDALALLGVGATVHRGPADQHPMARAACFAGLGPGEVTGDGRKLVGISQRRTRAGARFQCVAYTAPPQVEALVALVGGGVDAGDLAAMLASRTGVVAVEPAELFGALRVALDALSTSGVSSRITALGAGVERERRLGRHQVNPPMERDK